jgi:hypothetical protein
MTIQFNISCKICGYFHELVVWSILDHLHLLPFSERPCTHYDYLKVARGLRIILCNPEFGPLRDSARTYPISILYWNTPIFKLFVIFLTQVMTIQIDICCKSCGYFHELLRWYTQDHADLLPVLQPTCPHFNAQLISRFVRRVFEMRSFHHLRDSDIVHGLCLLF